MKILKFLPVLLAVLLFSKPIMADNPDWQSDKLHINVYSQQSEQTLQVLVKFRMKDGWHISWDNPGDAGKPTKFFWHIPNDWFVTQLQESIPQKFIYNNIVSQYGYGETAYYLFEISNPENKIKTINQASLDIQWTACRDVCEPGNAHFELKKTNKSVWEKELQLAKATFPVKISQPIQAENTNYVMKLLFPSSVFELHTEPFYFIPYERWLVSAEATQKKTLTNNNKLEIQVETNIEDFIPSKGVLIYGTKAYVYDVVPFGHAKPVQEEYPYWVWLLAAFLGGIILNCMPCVFPILSIKAFALAKSSLQKDHIHRACSYFFGVISCFLFIALILYLLRYGGAEAGWGFQLQSSWFVGIMLCLFVFLFLLVADIIKIKGNFLDFFNQYAGLNSFMTGFLAVLIASPCTGPFMGAAVGYALFQPPHVYFPIFLSLGAGYALPFTLAEIYPTAIRKILPKPGRWMIILKKILSIPILLTCVWLGWVLYHQLCQPVQQNEKSIWLTYDKNQVARKRASGHAVFIDFTARWCITCLANEKLVLNTDAFVNLASENDIVLFKADWTTNDAEITKALKQFNRTGVPLYVYYPSQKQKKQNNDAIILPQLLTIDVIQKYLNIQNKDDD